MGHGTTQHHGRIHPVTAEAEQVASARRRAASVSVLLLGLCVAAIPTGADRPRAGDTAGSQRSTSAVLAIGVDPNSAAWYELAQLPGIGESLGRRIEEYRRRHERADSENPVFRRVADLDAVNGIGQKTLARIGPLLRVAPRD